MNSKNPWVQPFCVQLTNNGNKNSGVRLPRCATQFSYRLTICLVDHQILVLSFLHLNKGGKGNSYLISLFWVYMNNSSKTIFLNRGWFPCLLPRLHWACLETLILPPRKLRPRTLLHILQVTGHLLTTRNHPTQHVNRGEVKKPSSESLETYLMQNEH